jgi:hypothetical protein
MGGHPLNHLNPFQIHEIEQLRDRGVPWEDIPRAVKIHPARIQQLRLERNVVPTTCTECGRKWRQSVPLVNPQVCDRCAYCAAAEWQRRGSHRD